MLVQVMAAPIISILSDLSEKSVSSHAPRVTLFGVIPVIILIISKVPIVPVDPIVAPEVGTVSVVSPFRVLDLVDYSSSSDYDPSEDSLPPVPDLPLVSPFLCSDNSEADNDFEPAEQRPVSSSHDTLTPLSEFPLAPISIVVPLSTPYPPTTSKSSLGSSSESPTLADLLPPRKRFRDSCSLEDSGKEHIEVDTANAEAVVDV
ncbi:hypothetical protein Tco_0160986, partial [Tanacetum coccineum]